MNKAELIAALKALKYDADTSECVATNWAIDACISLAEQLDEPKVWYSVCYENDKEGGMFPFNDLTKAADFYAAKKAYGWPKVNITAIKETPNADK